MLVIEKLNPRSGLYSVYLMPQDVEVLMWRPASHRDSKIAELSGAYVPKGARVVTGGCFYTAEYFTGQTDLENEEFTE